MSNSIYCQEWQLHASSEDGRIKLTFESFSIEAHESGACIFDYLEVSYNSYSWKYCGHNTPGPIISSGGSMKVTFHSDLLEADTGFIARWEEVEGEVMMTIKWTILTPHSQQQQSTLQVQIILPHLIILTTISMMTPRYIITLIIHELWIFNWVNID